MSEPPPGQSSKASSVTVYTDGGADPNPGPGGWGVVLLHPASGRVEERSGGEPHTTNNRMELTAAICALEALKERCRVHLFTDSQYLRRGVTEWLPGWAERGWRRKAGELQNADLWRRLAELAARHEVRWEWLKGHAGNRHNERADELATAAIAEQRLSRSPSPSAARPPDAEVFLRVSSSAGRGGWAALIRQTGQERILSGSAAGSAGYLDLLAATTALESLPPGLSVAVYTGSDYLRHGASRWLDGWRRRGWTTQERKPVLYRDLWERLAAAIAARRLDWPELDDRERAELDRLVPLARQAAAG